MSDRDFEYFRELDAFLLEQEKANEEAKKWIDHDHQDLVVGWAHNIITVEDVADYGTDTAA